MNASSRESNSVQVWVILREVCCFGGHFLKRIHRQCYPQGRRKGFPLAWKWLIMVISFWLMPELSCCLGCHFYPSHPPCCISRSLYSLCLLFQLSYLTLHSAAVWSGVLLTFFRRQNSGCPYLPRSLKPGCRELGSQSNSSSSMRAKILLAWIISSRMQARNIKPNAMQLLSQLWMLIQFFLSRK